MSSFSDVIAMSPYNNNSTMLELKIDNDGDGYVLSDVVKMDGTYTLSIWIKSNKNSVVIFDVLGTAKVVDVSTNWQKVVCTVKANNTDVNNDIVITPEVNTTTYLYEAFLCEGTIDNSWLPAPEDIEDGVSSVKSELIQTAEKIEQKITVSDGRITSLAATVDGINARVETAEGDISSLKTADGEIAAEVENNKKEIGSLKVQAGNIHLEVGKKDDIIPTQIRYIRDYLNGNDKDETNHFCMIEVLSNETNLSSGVVNLSSGLVPTSDVEITDAANYTDSDLNTYASTPSGNHYLQLDLKSGEEPIPQVDSIHIWHYSDNRKCKHKLQVSEDGVVWYTLYNSDLQGDYSETSDGKIYYIDDNTISKNMAFINVSINEITQKVQENENNYASITTEIGKVTTRVEEVESIANEVINTALPNLESNINKKIADIQVVADSITNSVVKIEDDLKQQGQEILEAGKWKVSLANIGGYDSKYADTEVYMELTPNGLTVSRSASDGYKTQITGDTIRIDYDNGRGQYNNAMLIDRDLMHLTRVFIKNGIDHGTIKEIPQRYGTIGALVFVSSAGSNS